MAFIESLILEKQAPLCELCVSNEVDVRKEYLTQRHRGRRELTYRKKERMYKISVGQSKE